MQEFFAGARTDFFDSLPLKKNLALAPAFYGRQLASCPFAPEKIFFRGQPSKNHNLSGKFFQFFWPIRQKQKKSISFASISFKSRFLIVSTSGAKLPSLPLPNVPLSVASLCGRTRDMLYLWSARPGPQVDHLPAPTAQSNSFYQ